MKRIELSFATLLLVCVIINFWVKDNDVTIGIFGLLFSGFSILYLFGGYFLFKPKNEVKSSKFLAISNGICISITLFLTIVKFTNPTISNYLFFLFLSPLLLSTSYLLYKTLRKSTISSIKSYFRIILIKNLIIFSITLIIVIFPPSIFTEYIYGSGSEMHRKTLQNIFLDEASTLVENENYKKAKDQLNTAISYSSQQGDNSSDLYQKCINELSYVYYLLGDYNTSDSIIDITLNIYGFKGPENIKTIIDKEYLEVFYNAIYYKALLHSSWGNYHKSDSLYTIALDFYKDDLTLAYIFQRRGNNQSKLGKFNTADLLFSTSVDYHQLTKLQNKKHYLWTLTGMATNNLDNLNFQATDSILNYCYSFATIEFGTESKEVSDVLDIYTSLNLRLSKLDEAEKYCLESIKIKEKSQGKKSSNYLNSKLNLSRIYMALSKYKKAKKILNENSNIIEQNFDTRSPIATNLYSLLSEYHQDFMDYKEAQNYSEKSLNGRVYWNGKYHINAASSYHDLASILYCQSKYIEADSLFTAALEIKAYYKGVKSPSYASSLNGLALINIEQDSLSLAKDNLKKALEIYKNSLGENHPDYAVLLSNKAHLKIKTNKINNAEILFLDALTIFQKTYNGNHIKIAKLYYDLGNLEFTRHDNNQAFEYFSKSRNMYKIILGEDHYFVKYLNVKQNEIKDLINNQPN
jgi:hypothetical protein